MSRENNPEIIEIEGKVLWREGFKPFPLSERMYKTYKGITQIWEPSGRGDMYRLVGENYPIVSLETPEGSIRRVSSNPDTLLWDTEIDIDEIFGDNYPVIRREA